MTTEEAKRFVEDLMKQAQQPPDSDSATGKTPTEPRRIEILSEDEDPVSSQQDQDVEKLRDQVIQMQEELRQLKRDQ